ncbi:MAG: pilus assembly protein [Acidobacteriia bacterium]|nr:pilus assembly protein [Terriglobia bacterium]
MKPPILRAAKRHRRRRHGMKGQELVEFTLNFLPFLIMIIVSLDTAWAIFVQSTMQQAVRMAVRQGVTLTTTSQNPDGSLIITTNLTDTVKGLVQQHAVGLLNGAKGKSYIKVNYFDRLNPSTDVSGLATGNNGGNIMQVSVRGYPMSPLIALFFSWKGSPDKRPMSVSVYSADAIEPMGLSVTPPIGPAP